MQSALWSEYKGRSAIVWVAKGGRMNGLVIIHDCQAVTGLCGLLVGEGGVSWLDIDGLRYFSQKPCLSSLICLFSNK